MAGFAYVNGDYVRQRDAYVHINDRGFQFADSIYEVVACIDGALSDQRGHLDRLERSLRELGIAMPVTRVSLEFIIRHIMRLNRLKNAAIYIQISRGVAKRDFVMPGTGVRPGLVVYSWPATFQMKAENLNGVAVITQPDQRWARRDIKTTQLLSQSLAKQRAVNAGAKDAWMVDGDGFVTEASASNAWIVKGKTLYTRQANNTILKGVTRTAVSSVIKDLGLSWEEKAFTSDDVKNADEAFTTSATSLIVPVDA